jgi:hypothetical protein
MCDADGVAMGHLAGIRGFLALPWPHIELPEHIAGVEECAVALANYNAAANAGQRGHHLAVRARSLIVP